MFCKKCAREIKEGAKFCAGCGSPVKEQMAPAIMDLNFK